MIPEMQAIEVVDFSARQNRNLHKSPHRPAAPDFDSFIRFTLGFDKHGSPAVP